MLSAHSDSLLKLGIVFAIPSSRGEGHILCSNLRNKSLFGSLLSQFLQMFYPTRLLVWYILNNYSPQCRWLVVGIYLTASRLGKYPPLPLPPVLPAQFSRGNSLLPKPTETLATQARIRHDHTYRYKGSATPLIDKKTYFSSNHLQFNFLSQ